MTGGCKNRMMMTHRRYALIICYTLFIFSFLRNSNQVNVSAMNRMKEETKMRKKGIREEMTLHTASLLRYDASSSPATTAESRGEEFLLHSALRIKLHIDHKIR